MRDRTALEDFLVRSDIALIKVAFFRERLTRSLSDEKKKALPRRHEVPVYHKLSGTRLRGLWTDSAPPGGRRELFAVSHAWLSLEHPDPLGLRLEALVNDLAWLKATDEDLVFFDFCSLNHLDYLHPDYREGVILEHPAGRSAPEEQQFQTAKRYMDLLFSSSVPKVLIMPEIYDIRKAHLTLGRRVAAIEDRYIERGWCGLEFSLACRAETIVARARPLHGRRTRNSDDLIDIEEIDFQELTVHIHNFRGADGAYNQRKEYEGAPYYEQEEGKHFLYRKEERKWLIGTKLGATEGESVWSYITTQDDEPPAGFWKVRQQAHHNIQVCMMKPDTDKVMVQGLSWFRSAGNGMYRQQGDHNGRPFYSNEEGVFIYVLKNGLWCLSPVLGAIGDLLWAENKNSMPKPPEGDWKVPALVCPDIRVARPPQGTKAIVEGFGWIREKGNGPYTPAGIHAGSPYFANKDGSVFLYRWREQRWRLAPVLGATGPVVVDQVANQDLIPPTAGWKHAVVVVKPKQGGEAVSLVGARATRLQGKVRIWGSPDGAEWQQLALIQEGFVDFETPTRARFVRVVLERDLAWVKCLLPDSVGYRNSPDIDDIAWDCKGPRQGNKVPVQTRQGGWVKAEKGWLPLYVGDQKAFEGVPGGKEEPYTCAIVGYRTDEVRLLPDSDECGLEPGQVAALHEAGAVRFSRPEDANIVMPMYRRNFAPGERAALLAELLAGGSRGAAARHIAEVRAAVQDPDGRIVSSAVEVLSRFGKKLYPPDIEDIGALLASPDGYLREVAATALGRIGTAAAGCADGLCAMLADPDVGAQVAAAAALAHLGDDARTMASRAAEQLVEMLQNPDREKRISACEALAKMGDIGAAHADSLIWLLDDGFLPVRRAVVTALSELGEAGKRHADKMVPLLADPHLRHLAVIALLRLECHQADIAALLVSQEWYVRRDTLLAFAALRDDAAAAAMHAEAVVRLLGDHHRDVRVAALGALAALPAASAAASAPVLTSLAAAPGEDLDVRHTAEVLLKRLREPLSP